MNKSHFLLGIFSLALLAGCTMNQPTSVASNEASTEEDFQTWLLSEQATDFDGDRKITEADYQIYKAYKAWLLSSDAYDYNGDAAINYTDYKTFVAFSAWQTSTNASDLNGDGKIDINDYVLYQQNSSIAGKYRLEDFSYTGDTDISLNESGVYLYKFADYLTGTELGIDATGAVSITTLPTAANGLGTDLVLAKQFLQNAHLANLSATIYSFDSYVLYQNVKLNATFYLTVTSKGFTTSYTASVNGSSGKMSVALNRVTA